MTLRNLVRLRASQAGCHHFNDDFNGRDKLANNILKYNVNSNQKGMHVNRH